MRGVRWWDDHAAWIRDGVAEASRAAAAPASHVPVAAVWAARDGRRPHRAEGPRWERRARRTCSALCARHHRKKTAMQDRRWARPAWRTAGLC